MTTGLAGFLLQFVLVARVVESVHSSLRVGARRSLEGSTPPCALVPLSLVVGSTGSVWEKPSIFNISMIRIV